MVTRTADGPERSAKFGASNKKSPSSETWFRRFRKRMVKRNIHGFRCSVCVTVPQLHAPDSDVFRALLARTKSKPSIALCAREILEIIADNLSKAGWSLGLCLNGGFQRANDLDCRRAPGRPQALLKKKSASGIVITSGPLALL